MTFRKSNNILRVAMVLGVLGSAIPLTSAETASVSANKETNDIIFQHLRTAAMKTAGALTAQLDGDEQKRLESLNAAIASYDAVLTIDPEHIPALKGRGVCKEEIQEGQGKSDLEKVVELSTAAIEKDKSSATAHHNRATALRSLKRFPEARADYQAAIALYKRSDNDLMDMKSKWEMDLKAMELEAK